MIAINAGEIRNPACNNLRLPMEELMIYLAQRLLRQETDADKQEFIRGVSNLNKDGGKKVIAGLVAGYIIANWLGKNA
jgi:hypothetical protein